MENTALNDEQKIVLDRVLAGHNLFIGGKAGSGKTFIVKRLVKFLKVTQNVAVTCTTGMACTLYEDSMTLHSFAGLKNARMDVEGLLSSIKSRAACLERWHKTDALIIDEVSQLSKKTFETLNYLGQQIRDNEKFFGGIQVIVVGDFFQLPPVKNDLDEGKYCFESEIWHDIFPHSVVLSRVYRQDSTEVKFLNLLGEFATGACSNESLELINELTHKDLNPKDFGMAFIPHIFSKNFDANFHNMEQLHKLPGNIKTYLATDTCCKSILDKVTIAEQSLHLKEGAEVMLLYNISTKLKNGTRGRVVTLDDDGPTVNFYTVGICCKLQRVTWFAYKPGTSNNVTGNRTQFPLKLAWGITAHKSQGQTLEAVCVHSGKEFVHGQLYVACSRVSSAKGLSITGFKARQLIPAHEKVINFYRDIQDRQCFDNLNCCREKLTPINVALYSIQDIDDPYDFQLSESDLRQLDEICKSHFTTEGTEELGVIDLEDILEDILVNLPVDTSAAEDVCPFTLLEQLRDTSSIGSQTQKGSLREKINELIDLLQQQENLPMVKVFIKIQYARLTQALHEKAKKKRGGATKFDFKGLMSTEMSLLQMIKL